jgi:DNA-binding CsgD family transcriptional regulator
MEQGVATIDSSLSMAQRYNLVTLLIPLYNVKHNLLADLGRTGDAYQVLLLQHQLSDSLLSLEKQKEILALITRYETEQKETENVLLKKDIEVHEAKLWLQMVMIALGALMFFVVTGLFWVRNRRLTHLRQIEYERNIRLELENAEKMTLLKKNELEKSLTEKEFETTTLENKLKEEKIIKLELETRLNQQELVYQSLARVELTQILRSVHEKLLPVKMKLPRKKDQEEYEHLLIEITRESQKEPLSEFEILFRQLHPSFYENLLFRCPTLTKTELHISAMIRLNLSSKDIGRMINLSVSSIDTTRYHIRQKLKLDPKDNLTVYLMTI